MEKIYKIKYSVEVGEFTESELADPKLGGCDALFYASINYEDNGLVNVNLLSVDGRTLKELEINEMFKAWVMLGKILSDRQDLSLERRKICAKPLENFGDKR
jgi:hypothetical protein